MAPICGGSSIGRALVLQASDCEIVPRSPLQLQEMGEIMTKKDYVFFNTAKEVSKMSDYHQHHLGCVIVDKNRIISSACNSNKTDPLQKYYNIFRFDTDSTLHSCHAETLALKPLLRNKDIDFSKLKIYLYREHANGELALSRPCASCMVMLKRAGIKTVYYTTEDGYAEENIAE